MVEQQRTAAGDQSLAIKQIELDVEQARISLRRTRQGVQ